MFPSTRRRRIIPSHVFWGMAFAFALTAATGCNKTPDAPASAAKEPAPKTDPSSGTQLVRNEPKKQRKATSNGQPKAGDSDSPIVVPIAKADTRPDAVLTKAADEPSNADETPKPDAPADVAALGKLKLEYDTDGYERVVEINFKGIRATDAALKLVGRFAALEILDLDKTQLTDAKLAHVKSLKNLRELSLEENGITNAGLLHLVGLKNLESLSLVKTKITGAGLKSLRGLTELSALNVSHCNVDDSALEHLTAFPLMETLALEGTKVNGSGFIHLAKLTNLITLNLDNVKIKGNAMLNFKDLTKIRIIYMRHSKVSKQSIKKLQEAVDGLAVFRK